METHVHIFTLMNDDSCPSNPLQEHETASVDTLSIADPSDQREVGFLAI